MTTILYLVGATVFGALQGYWALGHHSTQASIIGILGAALAGFFGSMLIFEHEDEGEPEKSGIKPRRPNPTVPSR